MTKAFLPTLTVLLLLRMPVLSTALGKTNLLLNHPPDGRRGCTCILWTLLWGAESKGIYADDQSFGCLLGASALHGDL